MYQSNERQNMHDTVFNFLILETINYILNKKIDSKQKSAVINILFISKQKKLVYTQEKEFQIIYLIQQQVTLK